MEPLAILFIILMVGVGGMSAFVADILGYKIGKKRLSIFRIRPKYVARFSVTFAGMLIPLLTIGAFYGFSSDFRTWLTRGSQAVKELQGKTLELEQVNKDLDAQSKLAKSISKEKEKVELSLKRAKLESQAQEAKLSRLRSQFSLQASKLTSITASVLRAKSTIEKLDSLNKVSEAKLVQTKKSLDQSKLDLSAVGEKLTKANREYQSAIRTYNETNQENLKLTKANLDLERANSNLNSTLTALKDNLTGLQGEIGRLTKEKESAQSQADMAGQQLGALKTQIEEYQALMAANGMLTRDNALVYAKGEEIARTVVPSSMSYADASNLLTSFLRKCRLESASKGAKKSSGYPFDSEAGMIEFADSKRTILSESESTNLMLNRILRIRQTAVMIARAQTNRYQSEPVAMTVNVEPNPMVLRAGEVIAESKIDGKQSEIVVFQEITEFVRTYVNTRARRLKMIPVRGRDGETFGELTIDQMLSAVSLVRSAPRLLRIQAVAIADTRAADPLRFEIVIK